MAEFDVVLIGKQEIDFYNIRNIQIHNFTKQSEEHVTEEKPEHDEAIDEYFDDVWLE